MYSAAVPAARAAVATTWAGAPAFPPPLAARLVKRIPVAAGLGGQVHERLEAVGAEVAVDGDGVGSSRGLPEGREHAAQVAFGIVERYRTHQHVDGAAIGEDQIEFSLFGMHLHYDLAEGQPALGLLREIRSQVAVVHPPEYNRFPNNFSHIFAGDYEAAYYAYIWAEVLARDAGAWFATHGGLTRANGDLFRAKVLSRGRTREPSVLFRDFYGGDPDIKPLLEWRGLTLPKKKTRGK